MKKEGHFGFYPLIKYFDFPDETRLSVIHLQTKNFTDDGRNKFTPVGYAINADEICIFNYALNEEQVLKHMSYKPNLKTNAL